MEELRRAARESLQQQPDLPAITLPDNITLPDSLNSLWNELSSLSPKSDEETSEDLLVAQGFLDKWDSKKLSDRDEDVVNYMYKWASNAALPGPVFGDTSDPEGLSEKKNRTMKTCRIKSTIAISVLTSLAALLPVEKTANKPDIVIALASSTSDNNPWMTSTSSTKAREALQSFTTDLRADAPTFWSVVEQVLKEGVKPLFAKTRNPAITDAGRKNFHPVPLGRFDTSILDPESKPWKVHNPYATTVFEWVIAQYHPTDKGYLERHFPLLIPPILSLIDDDNLAFKARGCSILLQLLKPIRESKSDILRRTNLSSVFEDAIKQSFFSLPTITPENDSIKLLEVAYPALLSVLKTAYQLPTVPTNNKEDDINTYITGVTRILRDHIIPSFHHISSTNTTSTFSFASFPYPRLSTLLVNQLHNILSELGIYTTKYLQEIIPVLYSTLSNPFGPAHIPLLLMSVAATRAVILNAHPRLWRWRGEILGGICACWVYAVEEEGGVAERAEKGRGLEGDKAAGEALDVLKKELRGVVYLLKLALENPVDAEGDEGQLGAKEKIGDEIKELIVADDILKELLLGYIDLEDRSFFGC